jgi:BlaI family transcriptional regulator, penicillinase repressor
MTSDKIKSLTKAEDQIMQILWLIEKGFIHDILQHFPEPKPAYNTVSTVVRILEKKGFINHNTYGKTHEYFPLISKKDYTRKFFKNFLTNYFSNSHKELVSFFTKNEDIDIRELEEIRQLMSEEINKQKESKNE